MKKKIVTLLCVAMLCLSACGKTETVSDTSASANVSANNSPSTNVVESEPVEEEEQVNMIEGAVGVNSFSALEMSMDGATIDYIDINGARLYEEDLFFTDWRTMSDRMYLMYCCADGATVNGSKCSSINDSRDFLVYFIKNVEMGKTRGELKFSDFSIMISIDLSEDPSFYEEYEEEPGVLYIKQLSAMEAVTITIHANGDTTENVKIVTTDGSEWYINPSVSFSSELLQQ